MVSWLPFVVCLSLITVGSSMELTEELEDLETVGKHCCCQVPICHWKCRPANCTTTCQPVCATPKCNIHCETQGCPSCTMHCPKVVCGLKCKKYGCDPSSCTDCETVCPELNETHCGQICTIPQPKCSPKCELKCWQKCERECNTETGEDEPECDMVCETRKCPKVKKCRKPHFTKGSCDSYSAAIAETRRQAAAQARLAGGQIHPTRPPSPTSVTPRKCCDCKTPANIKAALLEAEGECTSPSCRMGKKPSFLQLVSKMTVQHEQGHAAAQCCPCAAAEAAVDAAAAAAAASMVTKAIENNAQLTQQLLTEEAADRAQIEQLRALATIGAREVVEKEQESQRAILNSPLLSSYRTLVAQNNGVDLPEQPLYPTPQ